MKQQVITIPDNMELVKISDTEYKIVEKKRKLPKSWFEFCVNHPIKEGETWISSCAEINEVYDSRAGERNKNWYNLLPNKEYAEAILALCQLIQLRDCYRQGWKPDYYKEDNKYVITYWESHLLTDRYVNRNVILSFQTAELRDEFLKNFKDLIGKTKPLFM